MKIDRKHLSKMVANLLVVLQKQQILSVLDLKNNSGKVVPASETDHVRFGTAKSVEGNPAFVINYTTADGLMPIIIWVNSEQKYVKIVVTATDVAEGFAAFDKSVEGDLLQEKKLSPINLVLLREELKKLVRK